MKINIKLPSPPQTPRRTWLLGFFVASLIGFSPAFATPSPLSRTPLFRMKPPEIGAHLAKLHAAEPDLRKRIVHLARQNIGQPYKLFLLGEFPFETIDPQPMFSLEKSDCVVFAEHTYAMALSKSWEEFFWILQRIRYKDGVIGVATRNHYTEADWNPANAWLVKDITAELAGANVARYTFAVDRAKFFASRYQLEKKSPIETITQAYVPKAAAYALLAQLRDGDMFNVISRVGGQLQVTHVGLIVIAPDGTRKLIHSSEPMVREETLAAFTARVEAREARNRTAGKSGSALMGFTFLRLVENPVVPPSAAQPRPR